ncbi:MAG: tetratricopeptide repeat protein [Saprospiraceae bacterium]
MNPNRIDSVFTAAERNKLVTTGVLRYEYSFKDFRKEFLYDFSKRMEQDSFEFISITPAGKEWRLQIMRNEILSRRTMEQLESKFRLIKFKFLIDDYEGFKIFKADVNPLIVPEYEFMGFLDSLSDEELFFASDRLLRLKSYPRALVAFQKTIDRGIKLDTSNYKMGSVLVATHDYVEGISLWEKAVELNPNYLEVYKSLGVIYYENSHFKKALSNFKKAHKLNPTDDETLHQIAETLYQLKLYNESFTYAKRAVKLNRDNEHAKSLVKMLKRPAIRKARKQNPTA